MQWEIPEVYAVKHQSDKVIAASRSGGIFTAISDWILEQKGVVYGCVLTEDFQAVHTRAETQEERNAMRGSKYIPSSLGDTFRLIKQDLQEKRSVLFTGTSCQVAGLKKFLGEDYDNLFCMDIVCHGVPSPEVWNRYLNWQERKHHAKISSVNFRNKKDFGWREHVETLNFTNGKSVNSRIFTKLFYNHAVLRPSCYECPFKQIMHPGDITIADYWGIEKAAPDFDDNKGVSLVLVNNEKGKSVFESVHDSLRYKQTKLEDSMQPPLKAPFPRPDFRDRFWKDFSEKDFTWIAKKYGEFGLRNRMKKLAVRIRRKLVGR